MWHSIEDLKGQGEWERGVGEVVELSRVVRVGLLRSCDLITDMKEGRELALRIFVGRGLLAEVQRP